ncbi:disease resistance protein TAO1 isoform X2 [Jatropha curcas]|uniref:disease resistance protein TAO1 isoform X2 n=1 Tax=Jatropha curcas TaxID=180498 RepID=UPI0018947F22|nr:disease resistance protein TAO1 isoform X2 [Jatropha curcas]
MKDLINLRCLWITTKQRYLPVGGIGCLKSLQYLFITDCDNLESLCEDIQGLKRLQTLVIRDCDSLVSLPPSVRFLASLKTLVIADCRSLSLTMKEDSASEFSLRELKIGGLSKLVDFPEWLLRGSTNSLKVIEVVSCHNLRDLPDYIHNIQSLEEFHIKGCPQLQETGGNKTHGELHKMLWPNGPKSIIIEQTQHLTRGGLQHLQTFC